MDDDEHFLWLSMSSHTVHNSVDGTADYAAIRADSPLLGFDSSGSGDPLHFPSPDYTRDLPQDAFFDHPVNHVEHPRSRSRSHSAASFRSLLSSLPEHHPPLPPSRRQSHLPSISSTFSDQNEPLPLPPAVIPGLHKRASALSLRRQTSALSLRQSTYHSPAAAGLGTPDSVRNAVYIDSEQVGERLSAFIAATSPEEGEDEPLFMAPLSRRRMHGSSSQVYTAGLSVDTGSQVYLGTPSLVPQGTYPYAYVPPSSSSQSRLSDDSAETTSSALFTAQRELSSTTVSSAGGDTPDTSPASASFEHAGVFVQPNDEHERDLDTDIVITGSVANLAPPMASHWSLGSSIGGSESISTSTTITVSSKKGKKGRRKRFTSFMSKLGVAPPLPDGPVMMVPGRWQDVSPGLGAGAGGMSSISLAGGGGSTSGEFIPPSPSRSRRKPALLPTHVRAEKERERERERELEMEWEWEREMEREKERFMDGIVEGRQDASSLSLPTQTQTLNSPYRTRIRTSSTPLPVLMGSLEDTGEVSVPGRTSSKDVDDTLTTTSASVSAPTISTSVISDVLTNPCRPSLSSLSTPSLPLVHNTHARNYSQSNGRVNTSTAHAHVNGQFNNAGATVNLDNETGTSSSPGTGRGIWTSNSPIMEYERERALPTIPASTDATESGKSSFSSLDSSTRTTSGEYDSASPPMSPRDRVSFPTLNSTPSPTPTATIPKKSNRSLGIRGLAARMMGHTISTPSRSDTPAHAHADNPELYSHPPTRKKGKVYDDEMTPFPFYAAPAKKSKERPRIMVMKKEVKEEKEKEKKVAEKRKLVISGIEDGEEGSGEEAVRKWCEAFGEVRAFEKRGRGCLVVDFRKASVADTVCRIQAQVHIRGAGSVNLSWYTINGVAL